jgi:predicted aldo/keto reductase-like oxidoreductase
MRLPQKRQTPDQERAIKQIRTAIDNGVNYIDTAAPYHRGESEKIIGKALQDGYREKVKIATKLTSFLLSKPEDMQKMLNSQLQKLQTDHIDYYLLHSLEEESWRKLQKFGALKFLAKAHAEGKIVNTGFSFHGGRELFKEIVDANDWIMCQIQFNFLDEQLQAGPEGLKYAASQQLAIMVMEPLRGGLLAGKVPKEVKQIYNKAEVQRSPAEWALRWVWNHPEVTVVLSGMNDEAQIQENIATCETAYPKALSPNDLAIINEAAACYRRLMKVPCTGCAYCMPCPNGVNIPSNFNLYNQYHMFGNKFYTRGMYGVINMTGLGSNGRSDASLCKNCGVCVKKCPQHIAISQELKAVKGELGGLRTKVMLPVIKWVAKRQLMLEPEDNKVNAHKTAE